MVNLENTMRKYHEDIKSKAAKEVAARNRLTRHIHYLSSFVYWLQKKVDDQVNHEDDFDN